MNAGESGTADAPIILTRDPAWGKGPAVICGSEAVTGFKKGVDLGFHTLEHTPSDAEIPDAYVEKFMKQGMAIMPTMVVQGDVLITDQLLELMQTRGEEFLVPESLEQITAQVKELQDLKSRELSESEQRALHYEPHYSADMFANVVANVKKLHRMDHLLLWGVSQPGGRFEPSAR